ncbi:MAG: transcription termination/antitermination protein NusG [Planctomycetota bacterium]
MGDEPAKLDESAEATADAAVTSSPADAPAGDTLTGDAGDSADVATESGEADAPQPAASPQPTDEAATEKTGDTETAEHSDLADSDPGASESSGSDLEGSDLGDLDDPELDGEPDPEPEVAPAGPIEVAEDVEEEIHKDWYILKVQSNRERSIAAALQRKVAIEGLEHLFGEIMVPTEKVTEFKGGKKKIVERKLWPGYIAVEMHVNDDTWFAIRETGGIGDFTGSGGAPTPMAPHEVAKILHKEEEETDEAPKLNIKFAIGDKVKVNDGNFESFEGEVATIDEHSGKVSVMISIFGRSTPVELEYWQVESL